MLISQLVSSQVKIGGAVVDESNQPIPFANIVFVGSTEGSVSDENGKFYLESSKNYSAIEVSFLGFETKRVPIKSRDFNLKVVLVEEAAKLGEVFIYSGKIKKKGNPAIAILEKVWAKTQQVVAKGEIVKEIKTDKNGIQCKIKN